MDWYAVYTAIVVTISLVFHAVAAWQRYKQYKLTKKQVKKHDSTRN
jgi:hypothetical protein